jgi:hypothetical protein
VRKALETLEPLWGELFPAEQARIIQLLIERVGIGTDSDGSRHDCRQGPKDGGMTELTVTVTVPFSIRKRGGRKLIITPEGVAAVPAPRARVDSALLKALARGFSWRRLLEIADCATIGEIAEAANISPSCVSARSDEVESPGRKELAPNQFLEDDPSRVLRMTLLAPEMVEAILAGQQPEGFTIARAMQPFPIGWPYQVSRY